MPLQNANANDANGPRVFLSHSSKDKEFVRRLTADLQAQNLHVWLDERELQVGDSIVQGVSDGLRDSDYFVVVVSQNSAQSKWVQQELNSALMRELSGKGVVVLPVRMDETPLPPLLVDRIYADFHADYQQGLNALLAVFRQETAVVAPVSEAPARTFGASPCLPALAGLKKAELRRRMDKRLSFTDVKVVWFDTFETLLEDALPVQPKPLCIIELIERADRQERTPDLLTSLCESYPHSVNP